MCVCVRALEDPVPWGDVTAEQPIYEITVDYKATYGEADFQGIFHFWNILMTPLKVFPNICNLLKA